MDPRMTTHPWPSVVIFDENDTESIVDTDYQIIQRPIYEETALAVSLGMIMTVCLLGNVTVLYAFSRCPELREQISSVFIMNLAITDIGCATTVMPFCLVSVWFDHWIFGPAMCGVVCFLNYCFIIASMWTLAMISIDRYLYCIYPFRYQELMTRRRAIILSLMTWTLGVFFGSMPSVMQVVIYNHAEIICAVDWEANPVKVLTYTVSAFVICFITPMIVMILCYRGLYSVARRHSSQIRRRNAEIPTQGGGGTAFNSVLENSNNTAQCTERAVTDTENNVVSRRRNMKAQERRTSRNSKAIRSICIMVAAYFICNTPFSLTKLLKCVFSNNDVVPFHLNAAASWIAFVNPCCNPIIYSIYREDFKTAIKKCIPWLWSKKVNTQISPAFSANNEEEARVNQAQMNHGNIWLIPSCPDQIEGQAAVCPVSVSEGSSNHPAIIISPPVVTPPTVVNGDGSHQDILEITAIEASNCSKSSAWNQHQVLDG